ncbi:MAG: hypothetical protein HY956_03910 [Deltaproteobacteria bacterium]|nr:hypothetical protein [Deltaproteobacteria bacterium]
MGRILQITKRVLPLLSAALLIGAPAFAAGVNDYPAGVAASGISGTRHNMGSIGKVVTMNGTTEICVFCHTPHHSNTASNLVPMWNRGTSAPTSFTAYGTTIGGSTINNTDIGSTTLACLSCHDGVTTFDNIVNAPGKGGVTAGGSDLSWRVRMPVGGYTLVSSIDHFSSGACTSCHGSGGWVTDVDFAARLIVGLDLTNDHPVSVTYSTDRAGLRATNTTINSIGLTSEMASSAATAYNGNMAQNRWAVKGFISDTATIADLLRGGRVECSSCHDPHFRNLSWDEAEPTWSDEGGVITWCVAGEDCSDGNFLRRVGGNTGSGVCRTCHQK